MWRDTVNGLVEEVGPKTFRSKKALGIAAHTSHKQKGSVKEGRKKKNRLLRRGRKHVARVKTATQKQPQPEMRHGYPRNEKHA
jgi:hypothetical protein